VRLTADESAVVVDALRRFALEREGLGRPDRAGVAQRALAKLLTYRIRAGGNTLDDESVEAHE
jgi:hypothetical protein